GRQPRSGLCFLFAAEVGQGDGLRPRHWRGSAPVQSANAGLGRTLLLGRGTSRAADADGAGHGGGSGDEPADHRHHPPGGNSPWAPPAAVKGPAPKSTPRCPPEAEVPPCDRPPCLCPPPWPRASAPPRSRAAC